jgi:hypothetical protein
VGHIHPHGPTLFTVQYRVLLGGLTRVWPYVDMDGANSLARSRAKRKGFGAGVSDALAAPHPKLNRPSLSSCAPNLPFSFHSQQVVSLIVIISLTPVHELACPNEIRSSLSPITVAYCLTAVFQYVLGKSVEARDSC